MKIKSFYIPLPRVSGIKQLKLPTNCWILDVDCFSGRVMLNAVVKDDDDPLEDHEFYLVTVLKTDVCSRAYDCVVDDLIYMGSCSDATMKYYVFEVEPKE